MNYCLEVRSGSVIIFIYVELRVGMGMVEDSESECVVEDEKCLGGFVSG